MAREIIGRKIGSGEPIYAIPVRSEADVARHIQNYRAENGIKPGTPLSQAEIGAYLSKQDK